MSLNYDPRHVISNMRVENDRAPLKHCAIPDLSKEANSLLHDFIWNSQKATEGTQAEGSVDVSQSKSIEVSRPIEEAHSTKKRTISEVSDMEIEQQEEAKKLKVVTGKEIIDVEQMDEQRLQFSATIIEEEVS